LTVFAAAPLASQDFLRGDANSDGIVSFADSEAVLDFLFRTGRLPCVNAADANDSGDVDIADVAALRVFTLQGGSVPPAPFPEVGPDPTPNEPRGFPVDCQEYGGGDVATDAAARLEVTAAQAAGGEDGSAYVDVAVSNGLPLSAFGATIRFPAGLVTGVRNGDTTSFVAAATMHTHFAGDRLSFAVFGGLDEPLELEPGPLRVVLEFSVCLAAGTQAGTYAVTVENAELVEAGMSRSIRTAAAGGVLAVAADVSANEDCEEPETPPPPPIDAVFALDEGAALPGGTLPITFRIRADAEVQGFAYSLDFDESLLEGLSAEELWQKPDGSEFSFAIYEFNNSDETPGNAGIDEGFAVGAVVIDFSRPIGLPAGPFNDVLRFRFAVHEGAPAGSTALRFLDGGQGTGTPVPNAVTANGDTQYTQDSPGFFVFVNGRISVLPEVITFVRADANGDETIDLSDPLATLGDLFLGGDPVACLDAADANDDGGVNISDAVFTLSYLYLGGLRPPAPFPEEGEDPTLDGIGCLYRLP
jgi:hypothetical protein